MRVCRFNDVANGHATMRGSNFGVGPHSPHTLVLFVAGNNEPNQGWVKDWVGWIRGGEGGLNEVLFI